MSLKIHLLGQFKILADEVHLELPSRPAQSLFAYLVLNAGVTQRREKLASLLWPEASESNARSYLRQALWRIRKSLESASLSPEDYLQISDISVTFDDQSNYWLDSDFILDSSEPDSVEELIENVRLYRDELLPGFYDEWIVMERDRLQAAYQQKMNLLLDRLLEQKRWDEALTWGENWIRLGYSPEPAFRALMRAHAGLGDHGMVRATFQRCEEALDRELGLEPSQETQKLYVEIRRGELEEPILGPPTKSSTPHQLPSFLEEGEPHPVEKPIFVARDRELAQLDDHLDLALEGQGRVVFITGEAGSGKTALVQEFARLVQETHPDLIVASGNCNAHTGIGDSYLPFREILGLLTGDVEALWNAGAISQGNARGLWESLPNTVKVLVEVGPNLIDTFVPGAALIERSLAYAPGGAEWLTRLNKLLHSKTHRRPHDMGTVPGIPSTQQSYLFDQYTRVLRSLAQGIPLVLVLDDLQWADHGSINLLFHLGRQITSSRILMIGAYRPEEVALDRDGSRHPLRPVVNELQRLRGDITIDLSQAEKRDFLEALLDSEANRLDTIFRDMLFQQTRGHPLFTVELLRGLQERGDLLQDDEGRWIEGPSLDFEALPARVEAVIGERIDRLDQPLRRALQVASVEGEVFTAEVVARVQASDERQVVDCFSSELDRRHRLIRSHSIERIGAERVSRYRFRHFLVQKFLYDHMDEVERAYLHEEVGNVLEELHGDQASEIAVQLARHYQEARITEKAIQYLHQAGEKALYLSAYQEASVHLTTALTLLMTLPDSPENAQQELDLQLTIGLAITGLKGFCPEVEQALTRARVLCQLMGKKSLLSRVLGELAVFHFVLAEYHKAREFAEEALRLAQDVGDPLLVMLEYTYLGFITFILGEFTTARDHLKQMITFYNPEQHHHPLVSLRGSDIGLTALVFDACCLWCLGYPDQALERSQEAFVLARKLSHPLSLIDVICFGGCLLNEMIRDAEELKKNAEEMKNLASERLIGWLGSSTRYSGEAQAMLGNIEYGIQQMRKGLSLDHYEQCHRLGCLHTLAEAQGKAGRPEDGLKTIEEAITLVKDTSERYAETELYRVQAELMLMLGHEVEAEASYQKAIEIARRQHAKSWELRATIGLALLWKKQGKSNQALEALGQIYGWFTEGFDTPDLKEAKTLLSELGS